MNKKEDITLAERLYIEEYTTEANYKDAYTLSEETGIPVEAIWQYRKRLLGTKAIKKEREDFVRIALRKNKKEQEEPSLSVKQCKQCKEDIVPILENLQDIILRGLRVCNQCTKPCEILNIPTSKCLEIFDEGKCGKNCLLRQQFNLSSIVEKNKIV